MAAVALVALTIAPRTRRPTSVTSRSRTATGSNSSTSSRKRSPTRARRRCNWSEPAALQRRAVALVKDLDFKDGTIEVDLAGLPGPGSSDTARGFVGVAFRSAPHATAFDCFYLRPTNGRADDQLRRNHSDPVRLGAGLPLGAAANRDAGRLRVVRRSRDRRVDAREDRSQRRPRPPVRQRRAQPTLIVNDLKRGVTSGAIGLWIGPGTEAYFRNLQVTHQLIADPNCVAAPTMVASSRRRRHGVRSQSASATRESIASRARTGATRWPRKPLQHGWIAWKNG